ncbi:hypothetical protein E8E11_003049 [Didymella keratinophila]|nr:hypothetical protein E8E11_003049 [Didymella keratinophila]
MSQGYQDKVDSENNGFNSKSHLTKLESLQKKYPKDFALKVLSVLTTDKYGKSGWRTSELTISDCEDKENGTYRISRTNAVKLLKLPTLEKLEKIGRGEPSQGDSAPPESRHDNVQALTEQDNDRKDIITMQSSVTDAPPQSSPAVQGDKGVIVAKEKENCLVRFPQLLKHMPYQDAVSQGYQDKVKEGRNKLNSPDDFDDLETLKKKDVNKFPSKIESVLTTELYHPNWRSTAIKLKRDERVYIMAQSKAQKVLTKAVFDNENNKDRASAPSQGDETHTGQSIVRSVETPCPLPKPRDTKMGNSQKCSEYLIVGKDLRFKNQQLEKGTPCMVRDAKNIHTIMLWSEIQDEQSKGTAVFQDTSYSNNGLHPGADRNFLIGIKNKGESSKITIKDAILWKYQSKTDKTVWYKTVFSEHEEKKKMEELYNTRKAAGDDSQGPIRSSGSAFVQAGKSKADLDKYLKKKDSILWDEYTKSLSKGSARDRSATPEADSSASSSRLNRLETTVESLGIMVDALRQSIELLAEGKKKVLQ